MGEKGTDPLTLHDAVTARLESAGRTLLAMRTAAPGPTPIGSGMPAVVRDYWEAYGAMPEPLRPAIPSARAITAMAEALAWIPCYIPVQQHVIRRVVQLRLLIRPHDDRPLYSWRRIGLELGASARATEGWHGRGIGRIAAGLVRDGVDLGCDCLEVA